MGRVAPEASLTQPGRSCPRRGCHAAGPGVPGQTPWRAVDTAGIPVALPLHLCYQKRWVLPSMVGPLSKGSPGGSGGTYNETLGAR
jgi:hypothetical protein